VVRRFRHWESEFADLERELRHDRPTLSRERLDHLVGVARRERAWSGLFSRRLVLAGSLTTLLVVALAAIGGFGQAASGGRIAAEEVKNVIAAPFGASNNPDKATPSSPLKALAAPDDPPGQDQYKPGCGRGDPNHEHTGPPGKHNGFPGRCPPSAPPPVTPGP
jgi:hypothetical protein